MPTITFHSHGLPDLELDAPTKQEAVDLAERIYRRMRDDKFRELAQMPTITIGLSGEEALERLIPEHCRENMRLYLTEGIMPGSFLTAVLENDLVGAFGKADSINMGRMRDYAKFLHNYAPQECFGSPSKVIAWSERGGLNGREKV